MEQRVDGAAASMRGVDEQVVEEATGAGRQGAGEGPVVRQARDGAGPVVGEHAVHFVVCVVDPGPHLLGCGHYAVVEVTDACHDLR